MVASWLGRSWREEGLVLKTFASFQKEDYHELLKQAIHTPVLLLDDMDKPKPSEFREPTLYQIINKRISAERPLAISSNCMPHELDRVIGEAARSRLMMALEPVPMTGTDYRLECSA